MRYKLNDPEKDKALRVLMSDEEIDKEVEEQAEGYMFTCFCFTARKEEIIDVTKFDPKRWNEFPLTPPPVGVFMRLISHTGQFKVGKWDGGCWIDQQGNPIEQVNWLVEFYKPWEDD